MQVQLVVFDMAGTTVYDGDAVNRCLQGALQRAGVAASRDDVNRVMGIAKPVAIRMLLEERGVPGDVDAIYADFLGSMLNYYRTDPAVREVEGATEVFRRLKRAGVKVALDTGFSRPVVDAILERLSWQQEGLPDAAVSSDEVAHGRPAPDLIFRAMELTGVREAMRVAKVGDTPADLEEGHAAGCGWVVGVTAGSHTHAELAGYPHTHLIPSIAGLWDCLK